MRRRGCYRLLSRLFVRTLSSSAPLLKREASSNASIVRQYGDVHVRDPPQENHIAWLGGGRTVERMEKYDRAEATKMAVSPLYEQLCTWACSLSFSLSITFNSRARRRHRANVVDAVGAEGTEGF